MAALSHGARHLRQGIGLHSRSIHNPAAPAPRSPNRLLAASRSFFSRLVSHLVSPGPVPPHPAPAPLARFSQPQSINARFSLPVKHALSRTFAPPRLPRPPAVPLNVTHVGLGTARAFHSGRPIFQNMVDNVPVAVRALWEAEWNIKMKKKEARRMRSTAQNKPAIHSREMLKPKPEPLIAEPSELDAYFPVQPAPAVTTHLLVPLAPTPTARLPLYARPDDGDAHPLLPIPDLASIHTSHRLHSLRVSTLFAKLDAAEVWDDPGVNVDAYAFGPRHDAQERQCTVLRVTFRGWNASRVRAILGDNTQEWYSLEETHLDGRPTFTPLAETSQDVHTDVRSRSPSLHSSCASKIEMNGECDALSPLPMRLSACAEHDLVLPTLDFSSAFPDAADNVPLPPQPMILLRTVSELIRDAQPSSVTTTPSLPSGDSAMDSSWECLALSSSFLQRVDEQHREEVDVDM